MEVMEYKRCVAPLVKKLAFCCLALTVRYVTNAQQQMPSSPVNVYYQQKTTSFPVMDLETTDSTFFNTSLLANKTVYVDFWFTACPPCLKEIPIAKKLQAYFASDTNVVFLNICIENAERKDVWKKMVKEKDIQGTNVFYTRNRPQKINLLRLFNIVDYPTHIILNRLQVMGLHAPSPAEKGWVHWAIYQATKNIPVSTSYSLLENKSKAANDYLTQNRALIDR